LLGLLAAVVVAAAAAPGAQPRGSDSLSDRRRRTDRAGAAATAVTRAISGRTTLFWTASAFGRSDASVRLHSRALRAHPRPADS